MSPAVPTTESSESASDEMLADDMARFYADPLGFVIYAFPWDSEPSIQLVSLAGPWAGHFTCAFGPDIWACELLDEIGREVAKRGFDGVRAVDPILMAVASGHGIGKSTITAWLVLWIMSTRPFAKGVVTANTIGQLRTKTWGELAKWHRMCATGHWFDLTSGTASMSLKHRAHPESWRCDAQTSREENSESFAGLHAASSTPFFIFDEASAIPDRIWEVAEGGTTDGEPMWFAFGNPTRNSGRFRECFRNLRHRWIGRQIDSREVAITNKKRLQGWVDDYGVDSDFVKVRVRGVFPSMSVRQFISEADVDAAWDRQLKPQQYSFAPVILGVDPAWSGDDEFVVWLRQGLFSRRLGVWEKNDNDIVMATLIARLQDEHKAEAVFVDAGYGTGIVSAGRTWRRNWQLVWFGGKPGNPGYLNKRAEMWGEMRNWLKQGGAIPPDNVLRTDLTGVETVPRADGVIQLESKEDMKRRLLPSPNRADALALTFAYPVAPGQGADRDAVDTEHDYDPFARRS